MTAGPNGGVVSAGLVGLCALHRRGVRKRVVVVVSEGPEGRLVAAALAASPAVAVSLLTESRAPSWRCLLPAVVSGRLALGAISESTPLPSAIDVRIGELLSVDPVARRLAILDRVEPREPRLPETSYDELVLVPRRPVALPEGFSHAVPLAHESDCPRILARICAALELASTEESERRRTSLATVVVVGGGATGVALAGEIRLLLERLLPLFPRVLPREARVLLVERESAVLPRFPALSKATHTELGRLGIDVRTSTEVRSVEIDHVLTDGAGEATRIDTRTVVYAGGHAACPILARLGAHGDVSVKDDGGTTGIPSLRVFSVPSAPNALGPSLARSRYAAAVLAARISGEPAPASAPASALASAPRGGYLALGAGAVACVGGPAFGGSLARLLVAWDRRAVPHLGSLGGLRSFVRHAVSGRGAPLPAALPPANSFSLSSK